MAAELLLNLKDLLTPKLGAATKMANSELMRMQKEMDRTATGGKRMGDSLNGIKRSVEELRAVANQTTNWRIFKDATREAEKLEQQINRLTNKNKGGGVFGEMFKANLASHAFYRALDLAIELPKEAIGLAMEREKQRVNFQVMTGDRTKGNTLLENITKMADVTPFEGKDLIADAKILMQYGATVNNVMPLLHQLGDISGADAQKMESLSMAFGKVLSEGKLNGRALEEMIYAGFNPLNEISKITGANMATLRKEMEKGNITVGMVTKAMDMATGTGGRFHDLMARQAQTLGGRYSTLLDHYHHELTDVGEALTPVTNNFIDLGTRTLQWLNITESAPDKLRRERSEIDILVESITHLNAGSNYRKYLLEQLVSKYPDLFGKIDIEHEKNSDLLKTLNDVNSAYGKRIELADAAFKAEVAKNDKSDLYEMAKNIQLQIEYYKAHPKDQNSMNWFGLTEKYLTAAQANKIAWTKKSYSGWSGVHRYASENIEGLQAYLNEVVMPQMPGVERRAVQTEMYNSLMQNLQVVSDAFSLAHDADKLKATFKDDKSLNAFMALASSIHATGNNFYAKAQDAGLVTQLQNLMNPSQSGVLGSGGDGMAANAENAMSGQRNITMNIKTLGIEKLEMHVSNFKEGMDNAEQVVKEWALRVANSAAGLSEN